MRHPRVIAWEEKLREIFDRIDHRLEEQYGNRLPLHPARPVRGATASPEQDGLFEIGAAYTAGFGSTHGEGYVVEARLVTLADVPAVFQEQLEQEVVRQLRAELPAAFPGRNLRVERDGPVYKIIGDLDLGAV